MSRFDSPAVRLVLLLALAGLVILGIRNSLGSFPGHLSGSASGKPSPRLASPATAAPAGPSPSAAAQPAPAVERATGDPLAWVTILPLGTDAAAGTQVLPAAIVGNFDQDPDQELILFSTSRQDHWLVEADGSRRPLHLPDFIPRGCEAVDFNGDGIDDLVGSALPKGGGPAPVIDLKGRSLGGLHWLGSRFMGCVIEGDLDGKPGQELLSSDAGTSLVLSAGGKTLLDLGPLLNTDGRWWTVLPVTGDFDGDGRLDYFLQRQDYDSNRTSPKSVITIEARNLSKKHVEVPPATLAEFGPARPFCADVNADGCAEIIYPTGIIGHKSGVTPIELPPLQIGREGTSGYHYFKAESVLAGDFDHDGRAEIVLLVSDFGETGPGGETTTSQSGLWWFDAKGVLQRRVSALPQLQAVECFVLHAGGKDHLVLTYMDRVRISQ